MLALKTAGMGWERIRPRSASRIARSQAYRLSFGTAAAAAPDQCGASGCSSPGCWCAIAFPAKRIIGAVVDLPFALADRGRGDCAHQRCTRRHGWIGRWLDPLGDQGRRSPRSALPSRWCSSACPFVVRSVEPVLADLGRDVEEAAATPGRGPRRRPSPASSCPSIGPALLTGFALAFARGVGEYGSVIFISGNMPGRTEIAPAADRRPARAVCNYADAPLRSRW